MWEQRKGTELDKLKRRMIRTVARLLKEKKTEEEVWAELKRESGSNCKQLWERMRSLTMKKLKRLLNANDRVENVPSIARMTLTDWLLYDLVIVHEKIDVIDRQNQETENKVLRNLFSLVQRFTIEGRAGDDLAEAWTAATVHYNSKGHQCSPMLLQRRWYQIKELTRHKMYKFWYNYRGNERLLQNAKQDSPTELQKAIALRYPDIITKPFPDWEERIEKKLVIMPEEFEVKMRKKTPLMKASDENAPDVFIVEQKIDTITLGDSDSEFSDDENSRESNAMPQNTDINTENDEAIQTPIIVHVKSEPQDSYENINTTAHFSYQPQPEEPKDRFQEEIERLRMEEDEILTYKVGTTDVETSQFAMESEDCLMPLITNVMGAIDTETKLIQNDVAVDNKELEVIESNGAVDIEEGTSKNDKLMEGKVLKNIDNNCDEFVDFTTIPNHKPLSDKELEIVENDFDAQSQESIVIDDDDDEIIPSNDEAQKTSKNLVTNQIENNVLDISSPETKRSTNEHDNLTAKNDNLGPIVDNRVIEECTANDELYPIITAVANDSQAKAKKEVDLDMSLKEKEKNINELIPHISQDLENTPTGEIAHRVEPDIEPQNLNFTDELTSEINFESDAIEFADDGIEYFEGDENLNELNKKSLGQEKGNKTDENEGAPKFDLKLLMNPVVYTTKLDKMSVFRRRSHLDTIEKKELIDKIIIESKPISMKSIKVEETKGDDYKINEVSDIVQIAENQDNNEDDDLLHNNSSDEYDGEVIDDSKKVKLSSNLLQKPRSRSYNPIQLCKNPDFNTRLKRLTVGFFSYSRNRVFLKACKPMTIDLSKAFESKLVNGTMYLKPSDQTIKKEVENITESTVSILPSAVAVQSLMDTDATEVNRILQEELKKRMLERNKTINLPNISVVRQINQQLLMAEVAPMMAQMGIPSHSQNFETVENTNEISLNNGAKRLKLNPAEEMTGHLNDHTSDNSLMIAKNKRPVHVETHASSNETTMNSTNETLTNVTKQLLPVADSSDNDQSKVDRALEKQKKRQERQKNMNVPSWITKSNYDARAESDTLLTIDTLYKMLNALDPCIVQPLSAKPKSKKSQKYGPVKNFMNSNANKIDKLNIQKPAIANPKTINVSGLNSKSSKTKSKRRRYCCWAKTKMEKLRFSGVQVIRLYKHKCPIDNCKCCCKELLRQLELDQEVKILERMQNVSEGNDNLAKAIEYVVEQSRDSSNIPEPPAVHVVNIDPNAVGTNTDSPKKIITNIKLKADLGKSDTFHRVTRSSHAPEVTAPQTNNETDVSAVKELQKQITIDLVNEEANVAPLSKVLSSKPKKMRVYSGNAISPSDQRKNRIHPIKSPTNPNIPPSPSKAPTLISKLAVVPSKHKLYSNEANDASEQSDLPCTCKPNVVVDQSSAMLLVDGSNECFRHTKSRVSKETRIYLNRKHMSTTERPFYVGKNKILLTNVKQPKAQLPPPDPEPITLPDGVQIILLNDGRITYLLDPNVKLTPLQKASMPAILSTIQAQVKASGIKLPTPSPALQDSCKTIHLDDDAAPESNDTTGVQNSENSNVECEQNKEKNANIEVSSNPDSQNLKDVSITSSSVDSQSNSQIELNQESSPNETNIASKVVKNTADGAENALPTNEMPVNKENTNTDCTEKKMLGNLTEIDSTTNVENLKITENDHNYATQSPEKNEAVASSKTVESNNAATCASRNLLSDLMEMSGILDEDITPVQQEPVAQEHSITSTPPESIMQPITQQTPELPQPLPGLSPFENRKHSISAKINEKIYELNPITSFAELKYACDNNGLFFKLDLNNGLIVPINVCIQKNQSDSVNFKMNKPTEVIDLTDEKGISINQETATPPVTTANTIYAKIAPKSLTPETSASDKTSILKTKLSTIEQKKQQLLNRLSNNLKPLKMVQKQNQNINILRKSLLIDGNVPKRKSNFGRVEAKIDLVDSDAPMEEEFLVDDSSDDSDDEPLSKVAKKMRTFDNKHESGRDLQSTQESQDESTHQEVTQDNDNIDFEEAIDAIEPPVPLHPVFIGATEPVPTQLVLTGGALNHPIILNDSFVTSNSGDEGNSQDDCILGF